MTDKQVNDADREAAADYANEDGEYFVDPKERQIFIQAVLERKCDGEILVKAFAKHAAPYREQLSQSNAEIERLRDTIELVRTMLAESKGMPTSEGEAYNVLDSALPNTLTTESQDG